MKNVVQIGICFAMPEKFGMSRLCAWSYMPPMRRKKRAVIRPCAVIWRTAPVQPIELKVPRPMKT